MNIVEPNSLEAEYIKKEISYREYKQRKHMNGIKEGSRVVGIGEYEDAVIDGKIGTVKYIGGTTLGIAFDEPVRNTGGQTCGHDLHRHLCEHGHGWNVPATNVRLIEEPTPKNDPDDWGVEF